MRMMVIDVLIKVFLSEHPFTTQHLQRPVKSLFELLFTLPHSYDCNHSLNRDGFIC